MTIFEAPSSTEKRTLVTFVLDRSGSMNGTPIQELNNAMNEFIREMSTDVDFCQNIEVAVISFDDQIIDELPPTLAEDIHNPINLTARGLTYTVEALNHAIDVVADRKTYYRNFGLSYTRSFIVLITDGYPDGGQDVQALASRIEKDTKDGRYVFIALGVSGADMQMLDYISGYLESSTGGYDKVVPLHLQGSQFSGFFKFIAQSSKTVSGTAGANGSDGISSSSFPDWLTKPA